MQQKIKYHEIMSRGFEESIKHDPVYFREFGFDWAIITLKLTAKIYLDWEKETQLCQMVRMDSAKKCNIKTRMPIRDLEHLDELINFFTDKKVIQTPLVA